MSVPRGTCEYRVAEGAHNKKETRYVRGYGGAIVESVKSVEGTSGVRAGMEWPSNTVQRAHQGL